MLQVKRIPIPVPQSGQVLIKVDSCPINPSDLYCMKGMYDDFDLFKFHYPTAPGWEGSGTIVESGGGFFGWLRGGARVSFVRLVNGNDFPTGGTYQQYCIANSLQVSPLPESIPTDIGSMSFVNPLTAMGLLERAQQLNTQAVIQTGAASQVGRMLIKLCKQQNMPLINIVRRSEQVQLLKEECGCEHVLNSSDPNFFEELKEMARVMKANVFIECVGGPMTGKFIDCLPSRSNLLFYGCLSEKPIEGLDPLLMIGRNITLEAWILGAYLEGKGLGILSTLSKAQSLMEDSTLQSKIQKKFSLSKFEEEIGNYYKNMTGGKFLLCPNMDDEALTETAEFAPFSIKELKTE